ncbi:MAG: hypothetical protein ACYC7I_11890 [Gammaproteobacteria bacterium]
MNYLYHLLIYFEIYSIVALSLNLLIGYGGLLQANVPNARVEWNGIDPMMGKDSVLGRIALLAFAQRSDLVA